MRVLTLEELETALASDDWAHVDEIEYQGSEVQDETTAPPGYEGFTLHYGYATRTSKLGELEIVTREGWSYYDGQEHFYATDTYGIDDFIRCNFVVYYDNEKLELSDVCSELDQVFFPEYNF